MYRDLNEIYLHLSQIYDKLVKIAMEDSVLSEDEQNILTSIRKDLNNIKIQHLQILQSDLHDHEFDDIATQILHDIVEDANRVANKDGIVTNEEKTLLDNLHNLLKSEVSLDE